MPVPSAWPHVKFEALVSLARSQSHKQQCFFCFFRWLMKSCFAAIRSVLAWSCLGLSPSQNRNCFEHPSYSLNATITQLEPSMSLISNEISAAGVRIIGWYSWFYLVFAFVISGISAKTSRSRSKLNAGFWSTLSFHLGKIVPLYFAQHSLLSFVHWQCSKGCQQNGASQVHVIHVHSN